MVPIILAGPAVEPVSVADMRAYLRLDDDGEDGLVAALIQAGRLLVEAASRRALIRQTWRLTLDRWPQGRAVRLPLSPLIALDRAAILDAAGAEHELAPGLVEAEPAADPPRLLVSPAAPDPGRDRAGIRLDIAAGYGDAPGSVPEPLRQAVRLMAAHWFEHRGDDAAQAALPPDIHALVAPFRRARL